MNSLTAAVNKKRKKSETKPQAQINKCNNEKRRREQENIYIEELAELISANFADMSSLSVKPDKCAILQEAVNQIRTIKQQESTASADPVQQGEVSSSRPTILSNEVYGPLLLEALEGFLFVINGEGKVEHLTDNISTYIKFTKEDVLGKSIYNFIHHGDHAKFHSNLHPITIDWNTNPNTNNEQSITNNNKSKSIDIRLLIKPPDDLNETIEQKQQRINSYELMHISSTQLRDSITDGNTQQQQQQRDNSGPFMLCVASRISQRTACTIEQFTTKLDTNAFKVICVDTSGLSDVVALFIRRELKNRGLRDLVPQQEVHKVTTHLRETVNCGQSTSAIYRLQIGPDQFVQVQTKSKLFRTTPGSREDSDFIMATHSIIGDNELSGGNTDPPSTGSGQNTASTGLGGPLMPSVVNGNRIPTSEDTILTSTNTNFNNFQLDNEYFDIFPSSTWELDSSNWQQQQQQTQQQQENRPDSTPTPTPNSSSFSANSPKVATIVQSSSFTTTSNSYYFNSLSTDGAANNNFVGLDERDNDNKLNVLDESNNKLRILLTKPQNVVNNNNNNNNNNVNSCDGGDDKNKDRILKELLNQQDEDGMRSDNRGGSPRGLLGRSGSLPGTSDQSKSASPGTGNDMLRKLLNDKSDDDDLESRSVGMKKKSELLQQLLKLEREPDDDNKKNEHSCTDDTLMRSLGFPSSPTDRTRKRSIEDKDDNTPNTKRTNEGPQVSSSGASMGNSLRERNKMLASLLEKNPSNHQPIPPIPASVISATPQEKLPRISDPNKTIQMGMNQNTRMSVNRMAGRPSQQTTNYLNVLSNNNNTNNNNNNNNINSRRIVSNVFLSSAPSSSTDNQNQIWEPGSADPLLSELLDQVIDFVPDEIMHLLDGAEGQQNTNYALSEAVAINNIQKSLMQCEGAVKSPGSPIGTPPAYSAANLSNQNNSVFPPPPNYSQAKFQRMQIRNAGGGGTTQQFAVNLQLQQRKQLIYQEQQKRRLLLQQKQQHLLIPSNAANNEISNNINSIQSIDSLLNNTVAPNVSLQRSSSVPNESQLSPPYGQTGRLNSQQQQQQQVAQQQQQQQPYSPHSQLTSPVYPQTTSYQGSAQTPAQAQFNAQLSPRQAYPQNSNSWQQQQARMGVQQNTMLSAQLTRPPQQQQRSINSPGSVSSRHSPYPTNEQFSSPNSPNSPFNSQYLRLPRANSVPNATTQLPGGLSSPRPYTSRDHHPHLYPPVPHPHSVPPMMGYQQDSPQYCYDQTGLPLAYNGGPERGRAPPPLLQPGVSGSAPTSEFVRQELRAVVGARTAHAQPVTNAPPNRPPPQLHQQQVNELETLGLHFEMASGASESPKLWGEMGSMSPQPVNSRTTMEEGRQGDQKSSLLQKLLSE